MAISKRLTGRMGGMASKLRSKPALGAAKPGLASGLRQRQPIGASRMNPKKPSKPGVLLGKPPRGKILYK